MTKKQYMFIDLTIFTILAVALEFINYMASAKLGGNVFVFLSYTVLLSLISIFRWGAYGVVVGIAGGFAQCLASGNLNFETLTIFIGGNVALLLMLIFIKGFKHKVIKSNFVLTLFYLLLGYLVVCLTRSLIATMFGLSFISVFKDYFVSESMCIVISMIVILIARKVGVFTEMNEYIQNAYEERTNPMKQLEKMKQEPNYNPTAEVIEQDEFNDCNLMEGGTLTQDELKILQDTYDTKEKENL